MSIIDAGEREAGLDPLGSFCVSAPAGSGKTELLIQRYLCLLARVQRPEQVLAITFTRKAAAEMQERVIGALADAASDRPVDSGHQARTRELALAALDADARQGWRLLHNSSRVNIRTIDGFCSALTRQMPVLSAFGAQASPVEDASPLYAEAVGELFALADSSQPVAADLQGLMLHFDNHWERLAELLQQLLARRDQWLSLMGLRHSPQEAEASLRDTLQALIEAVLATLRSHFGHCLGEVHELQCFAASNLGQAEPAAVEAGSADELAQWCTLRDFLLTKSGTWRASVTVRQGFPPPKGEAAERNAWMKERMQALLAELAGDERARETLLDATLLPRINDDQQSWRLVLQLAHVLPVLAAQLLLVFQRHGVVDHSQVAQSALDALGTDEMPTDLALRLDYQIEHILVDEFQDTSINQFELVRRLTRGWAEHNAANPSAPRTYFIVGDGMQSIYGFRDANVGLFLQARDQGFNGVVPDYLELRSNFRSRRGVVDWVNRTFAGVFPAVDDIGRGEVSFAEASPVKDAGEEEPVSLTVYTGEGAEVAEADAVCDAIADALAADSDSSVAVLGRSRGLLQPLLARLRERGIAFAAQDMDRLSRSPAVTDLFTLVRALANRADRVAWLALLRAPWCGLALADLLALARAGEGGAHQDLLALMAQCESLSEQGRQGATHLQDTLMWAEERRDRLSLRAWVEQVWFRLGGPATLESPGLLADAEQFFQLLERADLEGRGLDTDWLAAQTGRLYASAGDPGARVQVMTLHKAKGLEFDHVFIPGLSRGGASDGRSLLLWDEYADERGARGFLLAADDHSERGTPGLYNYLAAQRKRKALLENTRLLYVGATRAIRCLHLSAILNTDQKGAPKAPAASTLLGSIWPVVADSARVVNVESPRYSGSGDKEASLLRLAEWPRVSSTRPPSGNGAGGEDSAGMADNRFERQVGTVVHWALEQLAGRDPLPAAPGDEEHAAWDWALRSAGLAGESLRLARERVQEAVARTLEDRDGGRWLLDGRHPDSACELAITRVDAAGALRDIVVDRTFVDATTGERWVVDYKTSRPAEGQALEDFLAQECERYRAQLAAYGDALAALGPQPVRVALYFTALARLEPL